MADFTAATRVARDPFPRYCLQRDLVAATRAAWGLGIALRPATLICTALLCRAGIDFTMAAEQLVCGRRWINAGKLAVKAGAVLVQVSEWQPRLGGSHATLPMLTRCVTADALCGFGQTVD